MNTSINNSQLKRSSGLWRGSSIEQCSLICWMTPANDFQNRSHLEKEGFALSRARLSNSKAKHRPNERGMRPTGLEFDMLALELGISNITVHMSHQGAC